jgi:hypothetical protein
MDGWDAWRAGRGRWWALGVVATLMAWSSVVNGLWALTEGDVFAFVTLPLPLAFCWWIGAGAVRRADPRGP